MTDFNATSLENLLQMPRELLMLDAAWINTDDQTATAMKLTSMKEPFFTGHFPEVPVMPGVLQLAAMIQIATALDMTISATTTPPELLSVRRVRFLSPVRPGMRLVFQCVKHAITENGAREYTVKCSADGLQASTGFITLGKRTIPQATMPSSDSMPPSGEFLDGIGIRNIIPHRYPFLLVDRVYAANDLEAVTGISNIPADSPFLRPASPTALFADPLLLEAWAQVGCVAVLNQPEHKGKTVFFMSIDSAEFSNSAIPGDQLTLNCSCELKGHFGFASGTISAGNRLLANATIKVAVLAPEETTAAIIK